MLHFQQGQLDPRDFWREAAAQFGAATQTDLFVGRDAFGIPAAMKLTQIQVDYIVVDTLRVPRETFAAIIEARRDGHAEAIGEYSKFRRAEAVAYFNQMIANILARAATPSGWSRSSPPVCLSEMVRSPGTDLAGGAIRNFRWQFKHKFDRRREELGTS
jgi:hypothetical protein